MKTKLILLLALLALCGSGWADNYTIFQNDNTFYDYYGSSPTTQKWTSGSNSSISGFEVFLTGNNVTLDKAGNWALVVHSKTDETSYTMTLRAPVGYRIKGYVLTVLNWSSSYLNTYNLRASNGTEMTVNDMTYKDFTVSGLDVRSTDISIVAEEGTTKDYRWLVMQKLVVTLEPEVNIYKIRFKDTNYYITDDFHSNTTPVLVKVSKTSPTNVDLDKSPTYTIQRATDKYYAVYDEAAQSTNDAGTSAGNKIRLSWSNTASNNTYTILPTGTAGFVRIKPAKTVANQDLSKTYWTAWNTSAAANIVFWNPTDDLSNWTLVSATCAELINARISFSDIIACGYTIEQIRAQLISNNSPAQTGTIGWPTSAAWTTFQNTVNAFTSSSTYDDLDTALDALWATVIFPSSGYYYIKGKPYSNYMLYDETLTKYNYDALLNGATTAKQLWKVTADGATLAVISSIGKPIACNSTSYPTITLEPAYDNGYPEFNGYFYFNGFHSPNSSTQAGTYAYNTSEAYSNSNPMIVVSYAHKESEGDYWTFVDASGDYDIYNVVIDDPLSLSPTLTCTLDGYAGNATVYNGGFYAFAKNTEISVSDFTVATGIEGYDDAETTISISDKTVTVAYVPTKTYKELSSEYISDNAIPSKLGQAGTLGYPTVTSDGYTNLNTFVTAITAASEVTEAQYLDLISYYAAYLAETDVVKPTTNAFWRIKGHATSKYVKANTSDGQIYNSVEMTTDGSDIWFYSTSNNLISYKNGLGTYYTSYMCPVGYTKNSISINHSSCTASGAQNYGVFEIATDYSSPYWYSNTNNVDRNSTNNHVNCEWIFEPVTSLPFTISSAGYATFYAPVALEIPAEVTAYVATDKGDYISLTAIEGGIIPANTGVILAGDEGSYSFNITTGGSVGSNALTGTVAAIARPVDSYVLATGEHGVALYKDGATKIPGFKAYLAAPSGGSVKAFRFEDDETGINGCIPSIFESEDAAIYNMAGQRVSKLQKGVNIVNGKKVLF